jgi:hypothetical protein
VDKPNLKKNARKMHILLQEAQVAAYVYCNLSKPEALFFPVPKSRAEAEQHHARTKDLARRGFVALGVVALLNRDTPEGHALVEEEFALDVSEEVASYVKDAFRDSLIGWGEIKPLAAEA